MILSTRQVKPFDFRLWLGSAWLVGLLTSPVGAQDVAVVVEADEEPAEQQVVELAEIEFEDFKAVDPQVELLQSYVRVRSALARRACKLSDEQEVELAKLDDKWLAVQIAEKTNTPAKGLVAGIARFLGGQQAAAVQRQQPGNLIAGVRKKIDSHIASLLNEQQADAYQKERQLQDKFRREAVAATLISVLDKRVYLSEDQRQALQPAIADWLVDQNLYWQFYFQNESYLPDIPHRILSAHLAKDQIKSLAGLTKWNYEMEQLELQMVGQQANILIDR